MTKLVFWFYIFWHLMLFLSLGWALFLHKWPVVVVIFIVMGSRTAATIVERKWFNDFIDAISGAISGAISSI